MINFFNYKKALNFAKRYFTQNLKELDIVSAQIYGSATYEECFVKGVSDIDICVFTPKMYTMKYQDIVDYIMNNSKKYFLDKEPSIVIDNVAKRIEFYLKHPQVIIHVTMMAPELPNSDNIEETVIHDSVDMFLGALYQYGVPFIGEIPKRKLIEDEFFPFYNENLREKRLNMLIPIIEKHNKRMELLIKQKSYDIIDFIYESRIYFIKWLFIYKRRYPVNLHKYLDYQLSNILYLPKEEKEKILFMGKGNLFKLASNYLQIVNNYLNEYKNL